MPVDFAAPVDGPPDLLVIAGEHSGDEHVANLIADMRAKHPDVKIACLGGSKLQAAGAQLLYDLTAVSIVGFIEVMRHYNFFKRLFECTLDWIERYQPKHLCLRPAKMSRIRLVAGLRLTNLILPVPDRLAMLLLVRIALVKEKRGNTHRAELRPRSNLALSSRRQNDRFDVLVKPGDGVENDFLGELSTSLFLGMTPGCQNNANA